MKRWIAVSVMLLALALIALGCGSSSEVVPNVEMNPTGAKDAAVAQVCKANLRIIYSSEQAYFTQNSRYATVDELAKVGGRMPREPAGGTYSVDPQTGAVTCSVGHGKYPE